MWLILTALAAMQYTPDPPAAKTVGEWLAVCDADAKRCSDQLYDQFHQHSVGDQKLDFCMPDTTDPQATGQRAAAWLKARPELAATDAWTGMNKAMVALHPCR
jgi:hypothetical protein